MAPLGAVGRTAVALARHRGVVVDGLVSRAEHLEPASALGLSTVASAASHLNPASYDAVLETAGVHVSAALTSPTTALSARSAGQQSCSSTAA